MYTSQMSMTPNRITRIEIYKDGESVKVIRNRDQSIAIRQANQYMQMMRGVDGYTAWLKR